jgi:hypothetical protein
MEDWEKNLQEAVEAFTTTIDGWVEDIEQTLGEVAKTIEEELGTELDWFWHEWSDFWEDFNLFDEDQNNGENSGNSSQDSFIVPWSPPDGDLGLNPYVPATANHQPACQGCLHYHGYVYGGKLLVCGMHPYGSDGEECPDWQGSPK